MSSFKKQIASYSGLSMDKIERYLAPLFDKLTKDKDGNVISLKSDVLDYIQNSDDKDHVRNAINKYFEKNGQLEITLPEINCPFTARMLPISPTLIPSKSSGNVNVAKSEHILVSFPLSALIPLEEKIEFTKQDREKIEAIEKHLINETNVIKKQLEELKKMMQEKKK